ncbi:hypothetical protein [Bacillus salitolerans]|uniref:hypothetical protein n=1 Tax=Bacillus salitolerans TaxID=1437434 RepID=UPI00366C4F68
MKKNMFFTLLLVLFFSGGCSSNTNEPIYSIDDAIESGDVIAEFFGEPIRSVYENEFKVENLEKIKDFMSGSINEFNISYFTNNGAFEKSKVMRIDNKFIFNKSNSILNSKGVYTCDNYDISTIGFSLTGCESDTGEDSWEVVVVPLNITMYREAHFK